ncbi:cytochrome c-type biogenesis protein CcmH, partial [Klebsiella pneumoniae]|nr:cytochrome c-type biogenesis protein CcmH [Klebsiella pneumoniae]
LTLWVWLSPLIGLALLAYGLWRYLAATRARAAPAAGSEEEIARLEAELRQPPDPHRRTP